MKSEPRYGFQELTSYSRTHTFFIENWSYMKENGPSQRLQYSCCQCCYFGNGCRKIDVGCVLRGNNYYGLALVARVQIQISVRILIVCLNSYVH